MLLLTASFTLYITFTGKRSFSTAYPFPTEYARTSDTNPATVTVSDGMRKRRMNDSLSQILFAQQYTDAIMGGRNITITRSMESAILPSNSPTSAGFVVTRFRNISTAMTLRPYSCNNTIWNAAKNISGNISSDVRPTLREMQRQSHHNPAGRRVFAILPHSDTGSVNESSMLGVMTTARVHQ